MSTVSLAAAQIYVAMEVGSGDYKEAFITSNEPYRGVIDHARECGLHNIADGSEDYEQLVDCLEMLVCNQS